jgi:hypothetical protein
MCAPGVYSARAIGIQYWYTEMAQDAPFRGDGAEGAAPSVYGVYQAPRSPTLLITRARRFAAFSQLVCTAR